MAVLPADWPRERLLQLAVRQALKNRLDTCVCFGPADAAYVTAEGETDKASFVPFGHAVIERLVLAEQFPDTSELVDRREALLHFSEASKATGYIVGDGLEQGELASLEEAERLSGINEQGFPSGLSRCEMCHRLRGDFLALRGEGNGDKRARVIRVHCQCENDNRCAGCGGTLADWRLSSYFWDEAKGSAWYVAAYSAFSHRCPGKGRSV